MPSAALTKIVWYTCTHHLPVCRHGRGNERPVYGDSMCSACFVYCHGRYSPPIHIRIQGSQSPHLHIHTVGAVKRLVLVYT